VPSKLMYHQSPCTTQMVIGPLGGFGITTTGHPGCGGAARLTLEQSNANAVRNQRSRRHQPCFHEVGKTAVVEFVHRRWFVRQPRTKPEC
jgi:hypothetical protein